MTIIENDFVQIKTKSPMHIVIGPEGQALTLADLPPANTRRWVTKRKAVVVACIRAGLLSLDDACNRYSLSKEEFESWQHLIENHGIAGLRATRVQQYRPAWSAPAKPQKPRYPHLRVVSDRVS